MASFNLNTGQGRSLRGFENRSSDVFGSLGGLEKDYDDTVKQRGPDEFLDEDRESPERDFKRPAPPRPDSGGGRREHGSRQGWEHPRWRGRGGRGSSYREGRGRQRGTPDHDLHPERWTEYTLEDTDVSGDSTNKRAAVDFLRDLRKKKADDQHTEAWDASLHCGKVEYKKPVLQTSHEESDGKRPSYSDVHKMPEFQFGQSKPKIRKLKASEASTSSSHSIKSDSINLGHLGEEEEGSHSESSARQTDQSGDSRLGPVQSESHDKTVVNIPEGGNEIESKIMEKPDCDDGKKNELPVFQKKAGKGKRNIRGRKKEEEED